MPNSSSTASSLRGSGRTWTKSSPRWSGPLAWALLLTALALPLFQSRNQSPGRPISPVTQVFRLADSAVDFLLTGQMTPD